MRTLHLTSNTYTIEIRKKEFESFVLKNVIKFSEFGIKLDRTRLQDLGITSEDEFMFISVNKYGIPVYLKIMGNS